MLNRIGLERRRSRAARAASCAGWIGLGLCVGSGLTMLFAPRRGREMRERLADQARRAKAYVAPQGRIAAIHSRDLRRPRARRAACRSLSSLPGSACLSYPIDGISIARMIGGVDRGGREGRLAEAAVGGHRREAPRPASD
ncbi:MAG: YtxH domain-containing protein [Deltaproteobacteria bacterium]|nr:MAG: YtxH domain-containing protein [Deltaproteobacteria bacterium]